MSEIKGFSDPVIQAFVDVLSGSLHSLNDKISNYQPRLEQIEKNTDIKTITQIDFQTKLISNSINELITDFYKRTDSINEDNKKILDYLIKTQEAIESLDEKLDENLKKIDKTIEQMQSHTAPVGKFIQWISKPVGFIVFLIGLILASITISKTTQSVIDYFTPKVQSLPPSQSESK